jgi:hypothetical protein
MERKGLRIKVLSGSISDSLLDLPKELFLTATTTLHGNKAKEKKIISDLWDLANNEKPTPKIPNKGKDDTKIAKGDVAQPDNGGQDTQEATSGTVS